jgi:hypothetical protein
MQRVSVREDSSGAVLVEDRFVDSSVWSRGCGIPALSLITDMAAATIYGEIERVAGFARYHIPRRHDFRMDMDLYRHDREDVQIRISWMNNPVRRK